jgi:hypothetical protein
LSAQLWSDSWVQRLVSEVVPGFAIIVGASLGVWIGCPVMTRIPIGPEPYIAVQKAAIKVTVQTIGISLLHSIVV